MSTPFLAEKNERLRPTFRAYFRAISDGSKSFRFLVVNTLSLHKSRPTVTEPINDNSPAGTFGKAQYEQLCKIAASAEARTSKLEQKALHTLTGLGVVSPILVAMGAFLFKDASSRSTPWIAAICLSLVSISLLFLAFLAVLRALAIRQTEEIGVGSIIGRDCSIRKVTLDFKSRGMLYVTVIREAHNDHLADFVKAGQLFLAWGLITGLFAGLVTALSVSSGKAKPSPIENSLSRLAAATETMAEQQSHRTDAEERLVLVRARQFQLESEIKELRKAFPALNSEGGGPTNHAKGDAPPAAK